MGWLIIFTFLYIVVITAMCWSSYNRGRKYSDKEIKEFVKKNTKKYEK